MHLRRTLKIDTHWHAGVAFHISPRLKRHGWTCQRTCSMCARHEASPSSDLRVDVVDRKGETDVLPVLVPAAPGIAQGSGAESILVKNCTRSGPTDHCAEEESKRNDIEATAHACHRAAQVRANGAHHV